MTTIKMFAVSAGMGKFFVSRRGKYSTQFDPRVPDEQWYVRMFHSQDSARKAIGAWQLGIWVNGEEGLELTSRGVKGNRMKVELTIVPVEINIED